jgi:predicted DNA-binding transcriptional regulator AlpA
METTTDPKLLASRILQLSDDAPELADIAAILNGQETAEQEEELLRLSDLSKKLDVSDTWLCRLGVPARLGIPFGGSRRYRPSEVMDWMQSEECRARVSELHAQRKARESLRKKETATA